MVFSLTVNRVNPPVFHHNPDPMTIQAGQAFTLTNLAQYFTDSTGAMTFATDPTDSTHVQVTMPNGDIKSLADSGLDLTISQQASTGLYKLSGTINDLAQEGVYQIAFHILNLR
ncbi:MAG: hypothetical protein UW69_C0078G0002 [Microgenomates group bacterium GW2011_GWA2_44_7]|nr:MAG: hypothetical protein UW69_C0078G0002 [Microgenomates group bacterium GW2011_GWA2_44_7]